MISGQFTLNGRKVRNNILAYGRERMLRGALLDGPIESAWYIGLISEIDITKVADNHTFADKNWTELTSYTVSGDATIRPTWLTVPHDEQEFNDIIQYSENTLVYIGTSSIFLRGLFLCDRVFKDEESFNIFSIAQAATLEILYPGQTITVGYTVAYK